MNLGLSFSTSFPWALSNEMGKWNYNYNIILLIPFLLFVLIFHNKAALLSLFQTGIFFPCRCLLSLLFFLFAFSLKPKPSSGSWCRFSLGGDAYAPLQSPGLAERFSSPSTLAWLCTCEPRAKWQPGHTDCLLGSLVRWEHPCFWQNLVWPRRGAQRGVSAWVRSSKICCSNAGGGLFPLEILVVDRELASVVSLLLNWIIFQGTEPAVWAPWGQQAASTGSTRLHPKRPRRGMFHPNPIISGELQHLKRFVLHKVHSLH